MSTSNPQPDLSATEELVAYLDGELPIEACRRVEKRLATDADYRRQLSELDQAWSALEVLPAATVDDNFTRTTIDMVTIAAERDLSAHTAAIATQRHKIRWIAAAGCLLLAIAAFAGVWILGTRQNRALVADLPVVAQFDELRQIGDMAYLRELAKLGPERFTNLADAMTPTTVEIEANWESASERRTWIEQLSDGEKSDLAAKMKRFHELAPEAQNRLRLLEQQIEESPDRESLQRSLTAYAGWVARQSPGDQSELRGLSTDERLRQVERRLRQEDRQAGRELSPADEQALQDAILELVEERRQEIQSDPNRQRRWANQPTSRVALGIIWQEMRNDERRDETQQRLIGELSPAARAHFQSLGGRDRGRQLWNWMREAMQPKFGPQDLQAFFASDKLTNDQREQLLGLSRSEMETRLEQMYLNSELGLPAGDLREWRDWGRDAFGPGRGSRGRDFDRGPRNGRDGRDGPPRDFEGRPSDRERFDRGPGRQGGPPGPPRPGGPPPNGGPRDWRDWPPPRPGDGPPPGGPPPEGGPPLNGANRPPQEEPF